MLPFPVKIYIFEIFTRATPGSSLVINKGGKNLQEIARFEGTLLSSLDYHLWSVCYK